MFEITLGNSTEWACLVGFKVDHSCIHHNCFLWLSLIVDAVSMPALLFVQHTFLAGLGSIPNGPIRVFKELLLDM